MERWWKEGEKEEGEKVSKERKEGRALKGRMRIIVRKNRERKKEKEIQFCFGWAFGLIPLPFFPLLF